MLDTHKNRIFFSLTNPTAQILKSKRINSLTLIQPSEIDEIGISLMKWTTINLIDAACGRFQINNDRNAPTWRKLTKEQKFKLLLVSLKVGRSVCLKIGKQIPQLINFHIILVYILWKIKCDLSSCSLHANPLARSPEQVKLDSDKWKFRASRWKKSSQRLFI